MLEEENLFDVCDELGVESADFVGEDGGGSAEDCFCTGVFFEI